VKNHRDDEAWTQFEAIYQPVIFRIARQRGLTHDDSLDIAQQVLASVLKKLSDWQHDDRQGSFRTWLTRVTRNAIVDRFRRLKPDSGTGGTSMLQQLQTLPQSSEPTSSQIEREYRRQVFRQAANDIQPEFEQTMWRAFWMTMIEHQQIADVAEELNKSIGAVYAARSRCMKRLRQRVQTLLAENQEASS